MESRDCPSPEMTKCIKDEKLITAQFDLSKNSSLGQTYKWRHYLAAKSVFETSFFFFLHAFDHQARALVKTSQLSQRPGRIFFRQIIRTEKRVSVCARGRKSTRHS